MISFVLILPLEPMLMPSFTFMENSSFQVERRDEENSSEEVEEEMHCALIG